MNSSTEQSSTTCSPNPDVDQALCTFLWQLRRNSSQLANLVSRSLSGDYAIVTQLKLKSLLIIELTVDVNESMDDRTLQPEWVPLVINVTRNFNLRETYSRGRGMERVPGYREIWLLKWCPELQQQVELLTTIEEYKAATTDDGDD